MSLGPLSKNKRMHADSALRTSPGMNLYPRRRQSPPQRRGSQVITPLRAPCTHAMHRVCHGCTSIVLAGDALLVYSTRHRPRLLEANRFGARAFACWSSLGSTLAPLGRAFRNTRIWRGQLELGAAAIPRETSEEHGVLSSALQV